VELAASCKLVLASFLKGDGQGRIALIEFSEAFVELAMLTDGLCGDVDSEQLLVAQVHFEEGRTLD
jgi:hypothetical protein